MLIDELQPHWHHRERHRLPVAAPAGAVFPAIRDLTWGEVPLFRVLMGMRSLGRSLGARQPILAGMTGMGFAELGRRDDELVYGAVGRPWSPTGGLVRLPGTPDEAVAVFAAFDEPGWARMVMNFHLHDGVLSTETRVWLTDAAAQRRFRPYWLVVRPFSGVIRRAWLRGVRQRALTR